MRKHMRFLIRSVLFAVLTVTALFGVNRIMEPKYTFENSNWPTTSTFGQFYRMEKNSIDVLFFGSSFAVNAFSPQEIYEENGIRCYNLGSEQQSVFMSWVWLNEALRTQSPKAVVLETRYVFYKESNTPFNMNESFLRKALDPMRLSPVKREAVKVITEKDPSQSAMSYWFTNLLYHSRWKEAAKEDLFIDASKAPLKGYSPIFCTNTDPFEPVTVGDPSFLIPADALMTEYLDKIRALCGEKGIELILVTVPSTDMHEGMHNTLEGYAREHAVDYYDFSEKTLFDTCGFDRAVENPADHMNALGAARMSRILASLLADRYGIEGKQDSRWEESRAYYEMIREKSKLSAVTDSASYFQMLDPEKQILFVSLDEGCTPDEAQKEGLRSLGIEADGAFTAVKGMGYDLYHPSSLEGTYEDGLVWHMSRNRDGSEIFLNDSRYSREVKGLHVTVYDPGLKKVVDEVCFSGGEAVRD